MHRRSLPFCSLEPTHSVLISAEKARPGISLTLSCSSDELAVALLKALIETTEILCEIVDSLI